MAWDPLLGARPSSASPPLFPRPPELGGPPPRKAVLSMTGLSYGVVRVDAGEKLSVLTVQDVGQVMPGGKGAPVADDHGSHGCPVPQAPANTANDFSKLFLCGNWDFNLWYFFNFFVVCCISLMLS